MPTMPRKRRLSRAEFEAFMEKASFFLQQGSDWLSAEDGAVPPPKHANSTPLPSVAEHAFQ